MAQDSRLFYGSSRQNVMIGRPDASIHELLRVAKITGLDAFAAASSHGWNLPIGENGEGLSGGQRQLVGLARALLARPALLFMDEPTSAMDAQTEAAFIDDLARATQQTTLVVVTHRPSLLQLVSRVIVIDGGRVVAEGSKQTVAGTAGNRVATGVSNGAVHSTSVDAVNGSQLYATAASTAAVIGGGSTVNDDGTISAPTFNVGGTTVNNVGDAITNLDGRTTANTTDISNIQNSITNISGSVANAVQYDTSAHGQVTMGGSGGAKVKMTNLQDADLSEGSSDAVTGGQLWNTNQTVAALDQTVQNISTSGSSYVSINTTSGPAAATGTNSAATGGGAQATGANSVAFGDSSIADRDNTVSVGSQGNEHQITNVAAGTQGTDAVN